MSVRDLTMGQLDVVFHAWLQATADFEADPRLTAWRPSIEAMLARVRSTSAAAAPDLSPRPAPGPTTAELDRAAEASVRTLAWALSAAEQHARADGNGTLADLVAQAFAFMFERGLRFLGLALPEQVGETRRVVTLARHASVVAVMQGTRIAGHDWAALIGRVEAANQALEAAITREAVAAEKTPGAAAVRIEGVRLANVVAQTAEAVLPPDAATRFLATFRQEVARAAARRAQSGPGAAATNNPADPAAPPTPADADIPDSDAG